jgi:hypothetical protein
MPFKDIDYKALAEDHLIHDKLYQKVAEINAIRTGNFAKAELLAGKELVHKMSPIEIFERGQKQAPVVKAIQNIPPPTSLGDIRRTLVAPIIKAIKPPEEAPPEEEEEEKYEEAVGGERRPGTTFNPDKGIDEKIIDYEHLIMPSVILENIDNPDMNIDIYISNAKKSKTNTYQRKRNAEKKQDEAKYVKETKHEDALSEYIKTLKEIKRNLTKKVTGKGLKKIQYGKYMIDKKKLGKGILSISYPNGKKVNGYPNMKVGDAVKGVLLNNKINKQYDLSETEKGFLRKFINQSEAEVSKSKQKTICNKTWDRMSVLVGQIRAGNTSQVVKNELADIAHHFYKNKELDKPSYRKILSLV